MLEDLIPGAIDLAYLPDLLTTTCCIQIKVLLAQLKLELESQEEHAGSKYAWLVLENTGVECH